MRLVSIKDFDIINSTNISVSVWCGYCPIRCNGCHNSKYWGKDSGVEFEQKHLDLILKKLNESVDKNLSILGGEPLADINYDWVYKICKTVKEKYPHKQIMLWTGFLYDNIKDSNILNYVDILIDGRYDENDRERFSRFKGSSNQRVIDLKQTLKLNSIVELEI